MGKTIPIPVDPDTLSSSEREASRKLAIDKALPSPPKSAPGNGKAFGAKVNGGARVRGGRA